MDEAIAAAVMALAVCILCAAVALLGVGAWWFAHAVREAHTARAHAAQADDAQRTIDASQAALAQVEERSRMTPDFDNPTDAELREAVLGLRATRYNDEETTTTANEGYEETAPIGGGGPYRGVAGFDA